MLSLPLASRNGVSKGSSYDGIGLWSGQPFEGAPKPIRGIELQETYLENRLRIRPLGVVSKKLIGLRKIAYAILSCSFREAYTASQLTIGSAISAKHPCSLQSRSKRACTGPSCTYANTLEL